MKNYFKTNENKVSTLSDVFLNISNMGNIVRWKLLLTFLKHYIHFCIIWWLVVHLTMTTLTLCLLLQPYMQINKNKFIRYLWKVNFGCSLKMKCHTKETQDIIISLCANHLHIQKKLCIQVIVIASFCGSDKILTFFRN